METASSRVATAAGGATGMVTRAACGDAVAAAGAQTLPLLAELAWVPTPAIN